MDSHYDHVQLQRERAIASGQPPKLYFAYSTILDRAAFEEWRSQHSYQFFDLPKGRIAEALDVDFVFDFQSRWWGGRVAGLTDKPGSSIWGVLFEIPGGDWPIIQHKEGAITNMCVEREVKVRVDGVEHNALAFTTNPARANDVGPVSGKFIEALIRGAQSAGLPADYLARLSALQG